MMRGCDDPYSTAADQGANMTDDLELRMRELVDVDAVRRTVLRYFRGTDTRDAELVASTYHPDAVDVRGDRTLRGPTIAEELAASSATTMLQMRHHVTTHHIEIDGDTATSEAYCIGIHKAAGEPPKRLQTSGRYVDNLERREGEWRITRREVFIELVRTLPTEGR
jgi:uncharacterized protein (TIGR02246 family)